MARRVSLRMFSSIVYYSWQLMGRRPATRHARHLFRPRIERLEQRALLTASVPTWSTREDVLAWIGDRNYISDEVIVALRSTSKGQESSIPIPEAAFDSVRQSVVLGSTSTDTDSATESTGNDEQIVSLKLSLGSDVASVLQRLSQDASVAWAAPNFVYTGDDPRDFIPNDPFYSSQYHHTRMQTQLAWDTTLGSSSIVVALTDDGTDWDHVDLAANILEQHG